MRDLIDLPTRQLLIRQLPTHQLLLAWSLLPTTARELSTQKLFLKLDQLVNKLKNCTNSSNRIEIMPTYHP